ncbi:F-box/kelch-repeat protein SKIP11 [Cajanus cajan]|uniref:F-box/kelch-repeat protein SKIP11 n=1 Tax=Cajanus cajan TaxID=3821 RepID=A0A151SL97_CAJCA|nr:F-box/kelch-repeat protein SKIP11 [Cajanus cajan]KYP55522.1 F-box/kelch-repeat protein SKIP11 [Cajanus cajan]
MVESSSMLVSTNETNSREEENQRSLTELSNNECLQEGDEKQAVSRKSPKLSDNVEVGDTQVHDRVFLIPSQDQGNDQSHSAVMSDNSSSLISELGRDISISCLLRLSRSDYGLIASLNHTFRSLVRTGELYQIRQKMGVVEHWVYFSCEILEWECFDPNRSRWIHLPRMPFDQCFMCSDKESLAVGTELLVFGRGLLSQVVYTYNMLTNTWSDGTKMDIPRFLFASASTGGIAIVAGGCDPSGKILSVAELYNSNTKTWETLPNMNKARKMCSAVFMDGKFYVLGGIGKDQTKHLTSGEEFDLKTRKWREIPNMFPPRSSEGGATERKAISEAPPLVAVVKNVLYAADYGHWELRRYVKESNRWVTLGRLPRGPTSTNGWGLAFRACGDQLVIIGGPSSLDVTQIEIYSWIPDEYAPQWNLLAIKESRGFVYNCAVMGC